MFLRVLLTAGVLACLGCSAVRTPASVPVATPAEWQSGTAETSVDDASPPAAWLPTLTTPAITALVEQAVAQNYALQQEALQVAIAETRVTQVRANRLPALSLTAGGQRSRAGDGFPINERVDVGANLSFEIDLWGKLNDAQRAAQLDLAAQQARFLDAERRLAADVVSSAFNAISSAQLQNLFSQRLDNLNQGLDIIEQGYRSGLNEALDVYLAQNTVEQERANVANQQQVSFESTAVLELLIAEYPAAARDLGDELPPLPALPAAGVPSELIERRPDIQAAWLDLLAADADLAVAHKDRFVSLNLTGSASDSDNAVSRLLDGGSLAFSAAASLLQPVYAGGRLRALERQAGLRVEQAEQRYLQVVFAALAEVETELYQAHTLQQRYDAFVNARDNAEAALELAFDQYQRGLVTFTTVLESQRRAFDAQTTVVQLRNQLLQSRIALLLALGGDY